MIKIGNQYVQPQAGVAQERASFFVRRKTLKGGANYVGEGAEPHMSLPFKSIE
jgi:hypothetical protein